jgi:hippurate hydrolase
MAGGTRITIGIEGHSGHGAMPHLTRDPMVAAGHMIVALQSVVARNVDPLDSAVVSICAIEGGHAGNVIPQRVTMKGTARYFNEKTWHVLEENVARVVHGVAATFGMKVDFDMPYGIGATVNHKADADLAAEACIENAIPVRRDLLPAMTGEDFSWFLKERPGAFVWIGNGPAEPGKELHNDRYDYNDAILPNASGFLAGIAKRALRG